MLIEIDAPGHEDNDAAPAAPAQEQTPAQPAAVPTTEALADFSNSNYQTSVKELPKAKSLNGSLKRATQLMKMIHY